MRYRRHIGNLKYLAAASVVAAAGVFLFLHYNAKENTLPPPEKHQTGYKAEDREKLEQLIHQGAKDD